MLFVLLGATFGICTLLGVVWVRLLFRSSSSCPWFSTKSPSLKSEVWFGGRLVILILDSTRRKKANGLQDASAVGGGGDEISS